MLIPPNYFLTPKVSKLLSQIEASKEIVESISIPAEVEQNIRRKSILKSSIFSARIEGNPTTLDDFHKLSPKDIRKVEITNILRAVNWINQRSPGDITIKDILALHSYVMKGIDFDELGKFRSKHEGIFSLGGVVIYHAPPPSLISKLIGRLIKFINSDKETFVPIKAILAHFIFEKIHPFADGSGRVGRLLMLMVLVKSGYGFKGILTFEEKVDKKREVYYKMLEEPERDVTDYLEFMLEILVEASSETKKWVLEKQNFEASDLLLPR